MLVLDGGQKTISIVRGTASPWLMDLIAFLKSVFESFTNLPTRLAQMSCMSSCQHLSRYILRQIGMSLVDPNLDVLFCFLSLDLYIVSDLIVVYLLELPYYVPHHIYDFF